MAVIKFGNNDNINTDNIHITNKTERQELAVEKWRIAKGRGTMNFVPRFGKTRTAIMIINKLLASHKHIIKDILIVVPNIQVRSQWLHEFEIHNINISNIKVLTRNLFNKISTDNNYLLIVFDEIHKYFTTNVTTNKIIDISNNSKFILGLTGTLPNNKEHLKSLLNIAPVIDTITETEAIANNWITSYDEYNIPLKFPSDSRYTYGKYSEFITDTLQLFKGNAKLVNGLNIYNDIYFGFKSDYDVITACYVGRKDLTSGRYIKPNEVRNIIGKANGWSVTLNLHDSYDKQIEQYWSPDAIYNRVRTFNDFIRQRKNLINSHTDKIEAIIELIKNDFNKETLIYTGSIEIAEELADTINNIVGNNIAITFHSKIPSRPIINIENGDYFRYKSGAKKGLPKIFGKTKLKELYINGIKGGIYKILITVESLNEGLNIPNLKRVISIAGTRNNITHKQRSARVKTIDELDLNKVGKIYNIYFDDFTYNNNIIKSVDKTKLLERQKNSESIPQFMELNIK
jgi:superfamily II DNA or RNA helicase